MFWTEAWATFTFHFCLQFSKVEKEKKRPPVDDTFNMNRTFLNGEDIEVVGTAESDTQGSRSHRVVFASCLWVLWQKKSGESWGN